MGKITEYLKYHRRKAIIGSVAALAVIGGGTGIAFAADSGSGGSSASTTTTTTVAPAASGTAKHHHHGVRGSITAISGDTWTIQTKSGTTYTVDIGSATVFGKKLTAADRRVGTEVLVQGTKAGTTIDATHVFMADTSASAGSSTTSTTS